MDQDQNFYKLLDILAKSHFFFLERTSRAVANKNLKYKFLNPFEITKNIKEFLKSLQDIKERGSFIVNIYVEDKFKKYFLDMCFTQSNVKSHVNVITTMKEVEKLKGENQLFLIIGSLKENKYKNLLFQQFYRIHNINSRRFQKIDGSYVIPNSMTDLKRIVLLIVLIVKVIKE